MKDLGTIKLTTNIIGDVFGMDTVIAEIFVRVKIRTLMFRNFRTL